MGMRQWGVAGLLAVAGVALWLLLAGPPEVLGLDTGSAGMVLLIAVAWASLYAIQQSPRDALERAAAPGEWKAWIGTAFMAVAIAYFLSRSDVFLQATAWNDPHAGAVASKLVMLLIAWAVLSAVIGARWKGRVEEDERDRQIARHAGNWGRGALTFSIIGIAVMLGLSPPQRLQWATHLMIANLLIFALMWSCLVEYAASGVHYWRDRH